MAKRKDDHQEVDNSTKMIVGLDIGTTKIVMVAGYLRADGTVEVCGCGKTPSTGVEFGSVFNVQETINDILTAKKQLEDEFNEHISQVYVGIAGRHIKSQNFANTILRKDWHEIVTQKEIDDMTEQMRHLAVESGEIIDVIPQVYQVDDKETMRPVGTIGQRINGIYQLIIGNSFEVMKIKKSVHDANLICNQMILEPVASSLVCLTEEEKKQGVAMIDIGGGTTDLVIYLEGMPVFIKVIPVGGCVITKDIESLGITFEYAEKLKTQYGTCIVNNANKNGFITISDSANFGESMKISEEVLAQVINARVEKDILEPVKREIENSGYASKVRNIVITGGGALLKDIKPLCEYVTQKRTRLGEPKSGLCGSLHADFKNPIYSTALGLLRYGCLVENNPFVEEDQKNDSNDGETNNDGKDKKGGNNIGNRILGAFSGLADWASKLGDEFGKFEGAD